MTSTENVTAQPAPAGEAPGQRPFVIFVAVFGGYAGHQILTPVPPPLARELGDLTPQYRQLVA